MYSRCQGIIRFVVPVFVLSLFLSAGALAESKKSKASDKQDQTASNVDLNTASQKDLESLPGVGPATTKKIIAGRPYSSVDDLSKAGVSQSTIGKIRSVVTVSSPTTTAETTTTSERKSSAAQKGTNT